MRVRRVVPVAALAAWAVFLAWRLPDALRHSWKRLTVARRDWALGPEQSLATIRTPEYVAAIRTIRATLPEDSEYVLLGAPEGADFIVRFDLAPRRAIFGGASGEVAGNLPPSKLGQLPEWTVIPRLDGPGPRLVATRLLGGKGGAP